MNFNIIHVEREKKSNTLTIIIIVDAIFLAITIGIFIIFFIRKWSTKIRIPMIYIILLNMILIIYLSKRHIKEYLQIKKNKIK